MKFRTELNPEGLPFAIDHGSKIFAAGSCFADRIGKRLSDHKFQVEVNPFGVIFNPVSLVYLMRVALAEESGWKALAQDLHFHHGLWHSWHFHSEFSHPDRERVEEAILDCLHVVRKRLLEAELIILTLGTARVYKLNANQGLVANCHKVPQSEFFRELLSPDEVAAAVRSLTQDLGRLGLPGKLLLTVSPVRHVRDGLAENSVSKAVLRLACDQLVQEGVAHYFPSYELMLDDLRDYRFYEKDLIHPNEMALDYIWEKFCEAAMSPATRALMSEWLKLKAGLAHRPFHAGSGEHGKFLQKLLADLKAMHGRIDLRPEIGEVESQLAGREG